EINMLDPAGYGTLAITHSISIVNDGVGSAGILVPAGGPTNGIGIVINAGPDDEINLRGLIIEGTGVGLTGIRFTGGKSLTIQNCVIRNMTADGIEFYPNGASKLSMSDCFVMNNGFKGVSVSHLGTARVIATFNRVESSNNASAGFEISGAVDATVTKSVAAANGNHGIAAWGNSGPVKVTVVDSVSVYNNRNGIFAHRDSRVRVGGTTVTGNDSGWTTSSGAIIETYGDNFVHGNAAGEDPMTPISPK
ncbi:MAG: hypothetical protein QOC56_635, partial [Alphaproteobacteria bacterium]|nr:hypothetical protein [Alphaproteobacteria bacterium]